MIHHISVENKEDDHLLMHKVNQPKQFDENIQYKDENFIKINVKDQVKFIIFLHSFLNFFLNYLDVPLIN